MRTIFFYSLQCDSTKMQMKANYKRLVLINLSKLISYCISHRWHSRESIILLHQPHVKIATKKQSGLMVIWPNSLQTNCLSCEIWLMITQQCIQTASLQDICRSQLASALRPLSSAHPPGLYVFESILRFPVPPSRAHLLFSLLVGREQYRPHELRRMLWFYNALTEEWQW